jgi:DNA-binding transcriptional LysR family regulator
MDIRQLNYFLEVALQGSFSKASQKLHLSQPTLSKMVKTLEDELGVLLLDRSTRRIELTDAGELVLSHAQNIMKSLETLDTALSELKNIKKGKIKIGLPPLIGASFFPTIIGEFHHLYPNIDLQLVEEGGKKIEKALLEGSIDLGVVVLPVDEELFESVPIVERELVLIVNSSHPLANRTQVSFQELQDESFILYSKGYALHDRVRDMCIRNGFEPTVTRESGHWLFISEMVSANFGISLLPETICHKLDPEKITAVRMSEPKVEWNLAIIWRKHHYLSFAAKEWINFVRDIFKFEEGHKKTVDTKEVKLLKSNRLQ